MPEWLQLEKLTGNSFGVVSFLDVFVSVSVSTAGNVSSLLTDLVVERNDSEIEFRCCLRCDHVIAPYVCNLLFTCYLP